ncbi:MAG: PAS domain-containing protein [Xanthobacteraceae bacterium]|jgi:PAS domain-containing protein
MPPLFESKTSATVEPQAILKSAVAVYPVGFVRVEPLEDIEFVNSEVERVFGRSPDESIGQTICTLVPTNLRSGSLTTTSPISSHG